MSNSPSLRRHSRTSSQRSAARIFVQAPGAPAVSANFKRKADGRSAPPGKNRGRAGRQGSGTHAKLARSANLKCSDPRTSTPRDIEACRNPNNRKSAKPPVRRTAALRAPMASRARCLRFAPRSPRQSVVHDLPLRTGHSAGTPLTGGSGLPAIRALGATSMRPGAPRLGPPGLCTASPMHRIPATASRPASGDADQTPLGSEGGMHLGIHTLGI